MVSYAPKYSHACIAEPHMMQASSRYKAHAWPPYTIRHMVALAWSQERLHVVCNSLYGEAIALACRLTSICVMHGADTAHHFEDY